MPSRRAFVAAATATTIAMIGRPAHARGAPGLKIGAMDGVFRKTSDPAACTLAKRLGLEGIQVTLGQPVDGRLPLEDPTLLRRWLDGSRETGIPLDATYIDVLHTDCLKNASRAIDWVHRGIDITRQLNASILMTVFFGKCSIQNPAELDTIAAIFRDLAPEAAKAQVILGFENLLDAKDNLRVHDRVGSSAFKIYYDVGNSTARGYNVPKEIRELGRERICQFHFKDQAYLGEGKVPFAEILQAIDTIGFNGFANLETSSPSGDVQADTRRNLEYLRTLMNARR